MNSLKWKRRISQIPLFFFQKNSFRKVILIYHAVGNGPWAISSNAFKKQIQWLAKNCDIVPLTKLVADNAKKEKTQVAITFDDGYACLYDIVLPILQAENAVATVYINTGWISENDQLRMASNPNLGHYPGEDFLTWNEVEILDRAGWEIGSHGVNHLDLTRQAVSIVQEELRNSKLQIENKLQKKCEHFAYTWGRHNAHLEDQVNQVGYVYAVAAHHAPVRFSDNILTLPRMNVAVEYSQEDFENIIKGRWDFLGQIHKLKKKFYRSVAA